MKKSLTYGLTGVLLIFTTLSLGVCQKLYSTIEIRNPAKAELLVYLDQICKRTPDCPPNPRCVDQSSTGRPLSSCTLNPDINFFSKDIGRPITIQGWEVGQKFQVEFYCDPLF